MSGFIQHQRSQKRHVNSQHDDALPTIRTCPPGHHLACDNRGLWFEPDRPTRSTRDAAPSADILPDILKTAAALIEHAHGAAHDASIPIAAGVPRTIGEAVEQHQQAKYGVLAGVIPILESPRHPRSSKPRRTPQPCPQPHAPPASLRYLACRSRTRRRAIKFSAARCERKSKR
jgi:hypothetical protein